MHPHSPLTRIEAAETGGLSKEEVQVIGTTGYGSVDLSSAETKSLYEQLRLRGRKHLTGPRDKS